MNSNTNLNFKYYGGITMKKTKTTVETETRWVITKDGIRMTYEEYIEMVKSENNWD